MNDKLTKGVVVIAFLLLIPAALAVNLDFTINLPKTSYYSNETIPVNISIINRDIMSAAKNLSLIILAGQRSYSYSLGDLNPSQSTIKSLTLPEFAPGTYTIRGLLNYSWLFGEVFTLESYNSFDVKFPETKNLPRNVYIKSFDVPQNMTIGKYYDISVVVSNNGTVGGDLILKIELLNESVTQDFHLEPNEIKTISINSTFYNPGISIIEAKIYAVADNIKYFLNYLSKTVIIKDVKKANLVFDRMELSNEPDNEINQNDVVQIRLFLKNIGDGTASSVKGNLNSSYPKITVTKSDINYISILPKESVSKDVFEIKTENSNIGNYNLNFSLSLLDQLGYSTLDLSIPIQIKQDYCTSNEQCVSDEICSNRMCTKLVCTGCKYPKDHACVSYECCSDTDCKQNEFCDIDNTCQRKVCVDVKSSGNSANKLDIVFVGGDYTQDQLSKFEFDVNAHSEKILSTYPFSAYKDRINVHRVDKFTDLGCKIYGDRCVICDDTKVKELASSCPNDKIIVLDNIDKWVGCAGLYGIAAASSKYPFISLHEFGHSFGGLWDEYSYGGNGVSAKDSPNCDDSASCSKWSGTQNTGCFLGCTKDNFFRSIENGIMRTVSNVFGVINENHLVKLLNNYK